VAVKPHFDCSPRGRESKMVKREGRKIKEQTRERVISQCGITQGQQRQADTLNQLFIALKGSHNIQDYWGEAEGFTVPAGEMQKVSTERVYKFPFLRWYGTYSSVEIGQIIGLEPRMGGNLGVVDLLIHPGGTHRVGLGGPSEESLNVSTLIPNDIYSREYIYGLKLSNNLVELYMGDSAANTSLIAIVVTSFDMAVNTIENTEPYVIGCYPTDIPTAMPAFWEVNNDTDSPVTVGIKANDFIVSSGVEVPARLYRLYDWKASSLLTSGTYDSGTSHKSHPFPVLPFDTVTILFRADTDSASDGFTIEVLTQEGSWRTYDSFTTSANTLRQCTITGRFPFARIGYEPSADGASITDAEVSVR